MAGSLIAGGLVLAASSPASALTCTSGVEGDVNGDGYAEVAVSGESSDPGGGVHVFYGRPKGLSGGPSGTALDDQYIDQSVSGVIGTGNEWDQFGSSLAFGDFNDDGCADLAVGAPGDSPENAEDTPGKHLPGSVYVFYGSKSGLKTTGSQRITSEEVFGSHATRFGWTLAAADLNNDGVTDLASGGGSVAILDGSSAGLSADQSTVPDPDGDAAAYDGDVVAIGDFDGDGVQELASGQMDGSRVQILEWDGSTFESTTAEPLTGPSLGVNDVMLQESEEEPGETFEVHTFGRVLAAGDVDADGDDDLAVGMPEVGTGGSVALVKGSASGLTAAGVKQWTQSSPGVAGANGARHFFGSSLAMGRLNSGSFDDLAIGTIFDDIDGKDAAGSVTILLGSSTGLTTAGSGGTRFHQNTSGIAGSVETGDFFGASVAITHVQSKTLGSLIIGVPSEDVGTVRDAGQFHQLSIATTGPKTSGSVALNLGSTGVKGAVRKWGGFGGVLD